MPRRIGIIELAQRSTVCLGRSLGGRNRIRTGNIHSGGEMHTHISLR